MIETRIMKKGNINLYRVDYRYLAFWKRLFWGWIPLPDKDHPRCNGKWTNKYFYTLSSARQAELSFKKKFFEDKEAPEQWNRVSNKERARN